MKTYKINKEVLYSNEDIARVNIYDIKKLKKLALKNNTKKIRLCTHKNVKEQLQEMLIVVFIVILVEKMLLLLQNRLLLKLFVYH